MGKIKHPWQHTDYVLRLFGKSVRSARRTYSGFISKEISLAQRTHLFGEWGQWEWAQILNSE